MRIVALSGSLRKGSSNAGILRACAAVAPTGVEFAIFEAAGDLPPFNPDLDREGDPPPPTVEAFRALLFQADAFVISCPEYAHGVPGTFKNALDWIVSSGEFGGKPVALVNASAGGAYVRRALIDTLTVMGANVLEGASPLGLAGQRVVDAAGEVSDAEVLGKLKASVTALVAAAAARASSE